MLERVALARTDVSEELSASIIRMTSHNRLSTYQLQKSATEHSSTCHCIHFYTIC
jgi:hypothetical protein